ncbi:MAG TPA: ABC transporter permease [Acidimicrobiales bacterium]|nr:ABC transporter permease [Acidimicrobiales bacterium]
MAFPALVIAEKDLRQRIRDRSAIILGVVAPLVIAALMSLAFSGTETIHLTLGVVNSDHGAAAAGLVDALRSPALEDLVTVVPETSEAAASAAVRAGHTGAAMVIPPGFTASISGARPLPLTTLTNVNNAPAAQITSSIAQSFVAQVNADRLSVALAVAGGRSPAAASAALAATRPTLPVQTVERAFGAKELKTASYYAPAMAIFFLLFTVSFTSRSFFVDRDQGMLERILAAPVRPISVLLGKVLSAFVFGVASLGIIIAVTTLAFGADWGDPLAAASLSLAMVLAVTVTTALVIVVARTQRQAEGISSFVIFGLALLGGNFVFVSVTPSIMQRLALLTPNGWALRGYTDLATTGGGLAVAVVPIAAILAYTVAAAAVVAVLAPRVLER